MEASEITPVFLVRVAGFLVFYVVFVIVCPFSFVLCIVCSSITTSNYPFGIFKLFLSMLK
jgi:hypothetical protein